MRIVGPKSCSTFVSTLTPNLKDSVIVSLFVPNRYERVSQTSYLSPLTRNAMNPLCVIRAMLLYTLESSFKRTRTLSARTVASSVVCGGWSHSSGHSEKFRCGYFAEISAREMPLLQVASWSSRRSGQICTSVLLETEPMDGKAFIAVWMVRVIGEMRMRLGTAEILICLEASCPTSVKGGSRWR